MHKYLVLVSSDTHLGGAQIRYLTLFAEISKHKKDYLLVINRRMFALAVRYGYLDQNNKNIRILEIDTPVPETETIKESGNRTYNSLKRNPYLGFLFFIKGQVFSCYRLINYAIKLNRIFKREKPSYVYGVYVGGMISWPLKYVFKFRFTYSFMDSGYSSIYKGFLHPTKNERHPLRNADTIDFLSEQLYHGVKERVKLNQKTHIAITPCSFKNYEKIIPSENKKNQVVFCSRLTPIKNPMLFLKSIKTFNNKYSNWENVEFLVLGDGACMEEMIQYKKTYKLHNLTLKGNVAQPVEHLAHSKVFVSIQQENNYPSQSLLEAMACENAIIASDVGETRKLVTQDEGILVSLNESEIADAVSMLLQNEPLCLEKRKKARKKALSEHNIDRYLQHFYSLDKSSNT